MADVKVLALVGSLRAASINRQLAELAAETAPDGVTVTVFEGLGDLPFYNEDIDNDSVAASVVALRTAAADADAALVVTPEYNGSIPGVLKNAIDWVSRMKDQPFALKPVALQSAATGLLGGSRMQYHLRQSLTSIDVVLFGRPEVIITFAGQKFDDKLELKDQATIDLIKQQLAGFEKLIRKVTGK